MDVEKEISEAFEDRRLPKLITRVSAGGIMLRQAEMNNNLKHLSEHRLEPVLLQTGLHDDAVRYFAPAVALNDFDEFLFTSRTLLCFVILVKLKQKIIVEVDFGNSRFMPRLRSQKCLHQACNALSLLRSMSQLSDTLSDEKWCPLT